jgi:hypothetical protein
MKINKIAVVLILAILGNGCVTERLGEGKVDGPGFENCPEQRPEMCAQVYSPVCGELNDGSRTTFSNGCTACAGKEVVGFHIGECK